MTQRESMPVDVVIVGAGPAGPAAAIRLKQLANVFFANQVHDENQPVHLWLKDPAIPIASNLPLYGVYEVVIDEGGDPHFQINAANCIAEPATSRIPRRISTGSHPKADRARAMWACDAPAQDAGLAQYFFGQRVGVCHGNAV